MSSFSVFQRPENLKRLASETFDLAIVGGGITGAGVARDAASRGMKVALVEANDFSFGTSSRSSKLIHGGVRYLENLEFGLVFEALSERKRLFEMAPHMVHPLKFVLPVYEGARHGMSKMALGMFLYDALALFDAPEAHEQLGADETMSRLPMLSSRGLKGSFAYYDAYMDDDRLTLETLRSAAKKGAVQASYVRVVGVQSDSSGVTRALKCRDLIGGTEFEIKARHFVGSVGPWTDIFGETIFGDWKKQLRPTKGVHITFDRNRLPLKEAIVMVDDKKNRIVFGIPRHEMIIVGTTDSDFRDDPKDVKTKREDIDYLLAVAREYFPGAHLKESDILSSYSGVRPLVHDGSLSEGKTSREHKIWADPRGFTFVAGGKYTTYRHMAEEIVDFALNRLSVEDQVRFGRSETIAPLNEKATPALMAKARNLASESNFSADLPRTEVLALVERHGMEAFDLLDIAAREGLKSVWEIEAYHAIHNTMCLHLVDFMIRRVPLFLARKDHGQAFLESIVSVFSRYLGWDTTEIKEETELLERHVRHELGWRLDSQK